LSACNGSLDTRCVASHSNKLTINGEVERPAQHPALLATRKLSTNGLLLTDPADFRIVGKQEIDNACVTSGSPVIRELSG
jgi:hypothetical protein